MSGPFRAFGLAVVHHAGEMSSGGVPGVCHRVGVYEGPCGGLLESEGGAKRRGPQMGMGQRRDSARKWPGQCSHQVVLMSVLPGESLQKFCPHI